MKVFLCYEGEGQFIIEAESTEDAIAGIKKYNENGFHVENASIIRELTEDEIESKERDGRYSLDGADFTEAEEIEDAKEEDEKE